MLYIQLYAVFFKIGLFTFGGGLSMLPLIEKELLLREWMTRAEFLDLVSVAQMTPGAIAVNSATYVGNDLLGFWGGIAATAGVITPSIVIILILATILMRCKGNVYKDAFFLGLKPITVGLIGYAGYTIGRATFIKTPPSGIVRFFSDYSVNYPAIGIFVLAFIVLNKTKLNPIWMIFMSGILGFVFL